MKRNRNLNKHIVYDFEQNKYLLINISLAGHNDILFDTKVINFNANNNKVTRFFI
jgi:hypothetical protein